MKTYAFRVKMQARAAQRQKISMRVKANLVEVKDEIEFANVAEVPVAQNYS
jgi:hypothetical protein